jgi:hypothetical protein
VFRNDGKEEGKKIKIGKIIKEKKKGEKKRTE